MSNPSIPETRSRWRYRKLYGEDRWLVYRTNPHDPDTATGLEEFGEYGFESEAAAVVASLNGPTQPVTERIPDLEAEERATYYTARSVPVNSAALYEAVNAYVDALTEGRTLVMLRQYDDLDLAQERVEHALSVLQDAASTLANDRSERRAQQTEAGQ